MAHESTDVTVSDELADDRVLVTGGAGFIGSHIADALVGAADVTVYDDFSSGTRENVPDGATVIEADVRDAERLVAAVEAADVVFHEAARVSVAWSVENPAESHGVNLDPVVTILEAARGTDTRVVFASSAAIYGDPEYVPVDEDHPKAPSSPYGLEKLAADQYCRLYHERYGVEAVALRYFNVYGPRQRGGDYAAVVSVFREQALAGDPITVEGDGTQSRDFVHVADVVRANLLAAVHDDAPGEAFNVGTGSRTTINELAETIRDATDSASEIVHVAPREGDIDESVADISRARETLGFEPEYGTRAGLEPSLGNRTS